MIRSNKLVELALLVACYAVSNSAFGTTVSVSASDAGCSSSPPLPLVSCETGIWPSWTRGASVEVGDYVCTTTGDFGYAQADDNHANCSKTASVEVSAKAEQKVTQERDWTYTGSFKWPAAIKGVVDAKFDIQYSIKYSTEQTISKETKASVPNCKAEYVWAAVKWKIGEKGTVAANATCTYDLASDSGTCKKGLAVSATGNSGTWAGKYDALTQSGKGLNTDDATACDCNCDPAAGTPPSPPPWWPKNF